MKTARRWLIYSMAMVGMFIAAVISPQWSAAQSPEESASSLIAKLGSDNRVSYHNGTGKVRFLGTPPRQPIRQADFTLSPVSPEEGARNFLSAYGRLFGLTDQKQELTVKRLTSNGIGRDFVRFQQVYKNVPIFGGELVVQLDGARDIVSVNGEILPAFDLDVRPQITGESARQSAIQAVAKWHSVDARSLEATEPSLWIYAPVLVGPGDGPGELVWRLEVKSTESAPIRELVLINAHRGSIALHFNQVHAALDLATYSAGGGSSLPGALVCDESDLNCTGGSADAIAAHRNAGDTYDFYLTMHGRDSIDNVGMTLISTVEYCPPGTCPYANAFWNGIQMVYGHTYSIADDVVGHELTHGVTEYESGLYYYYQSGAINESFSDVWGEFVDLTYNAASTDAPADRWLMGEDLPIGAIRSMQDPTLFGDPDRITSPHYYVGAGDNGGVHYNSGINNKAVYLMIDGDTFNGISVTALDIPKVAAIYYEVQTNLLVSGSDYADLYDALYQACLNRLGVDGITEDDCQQVRNATDAVEMNLQPVPDFNTDAPLCDVGMTPNLLFFDDFELGSAAWDEQVLVGSSHWYYGSPYGDFAHSGENFLYADDYPDEVTDVAVTMLNPVLGLPADAYLHFAHAYAFEFGGYDGGVLEYTTDNGASWNDAAPLFEYNGYDGLISTGYGNPLGGREGFLEDSHGYISSRLDLAPLATQNVRFRWRMGLDSSFYNWGWWLDDVQIYTCVVPNDPPSFDSTAVITATEGEPYSYAIATSDPNAGDTRTITAPTKPSWLTLTDNGNGTATLSGTPGAAAVGTHNVTLRVTDAGGLFAEQSFTITVTEANDPPSFDSTAVITATEGEPYSYAVTTSDPNAGDTRTISAPTKPGWLTLTDNGNGTATLSGTPGAAAVGTHNVTLRVTDSGGLFAEQSFTVTVGEANGAPSFTSTALTAASAGQPYSYAITTSDPNAGDTRAITAPTKPSWLTLTDNGNGTATLSGTPTAADVGTHNVTLRVTDTGGLSAEQSFTVTVTSGEEAVYLPLVQTLAD